MSTTVKPTPVEEWLSKSQEPEAPTGASLRVTVVYGSSKGESNAASWLAKDILEAIGSEMPGRLQVAEFHLPDMKIAPCYNCYGGGGHACAYPCDRNDVEHKLYDKDDEMPKIHERLIEGDVLIIAADSRWGGLNNFVQRFLERMNPFPAQVALDKPALHNKVACLAVVGDSPMPVVGQLMTALNASGFAFPCYGYVAWNIPRMASKESVKAAFEKSTAVHNDVSLVAADLVRFAKLLKGV